MNAYDRARAIMDARWHRAAASSAISGGSCKPQDLRDYRHWIMVSVLLGDVTADEARASVDRAEMIHRMNLVTIKPATRR